MKQQKSTDSEEITRTFFYGVTFLQVETNWVERHSLENGAVSPVDLREWDERLRFAEQNLQKSAVFEEKA